MDAKTAKDRLRRVTGQMKARGIDCLIVVTGENVTWLTGFMGHDSWALIIGRRVTLVTDSRYTEQARAECVGCRIVERKGAMPGAVAKIIGRCRSVEKVGLEDAATVHLSAALKKRVNIRIKPVGNIIESVRRTKDTGEVRIITAAARIAWRALNATLGQLHAGMTESAAAGLLEFEMRKLGAGAGFETIMAFGPNASRNHHQPGARKLRNKDTILIDFGVKTGGYCCDMTRCFVFGACTRFYEKVYYAVLAAQQAAISKIRAGAALHDIDSAARSVLGDRGLPVYGHGTGHGIGLQVHENPFMSALAVDSLQAGDVVTVEPGVYIPGKLGVRMEDDILVTETGYKILSTDRRFGFSSGEMPVLKSR